MSHHLLGDFYNLLLAFSDATQLVGQSLSALSAATLKNVATVSGLHSLSEAMLLLSLTLLRLVSSEHIGLPPSRFAVGA